MKKLYFFTSILLLLLGCKSDDDANITENISLIGTWNLVAWYDTTARDINNDGNASTDLLSQWNGCKKHSKMILREDHTGDVIYTGPDNNPNCPQDFQTNDTFSTGPWYTEEPPVIFTLIGDDFEDPYYIVELSSTTLILQGAGFLTCCDPDISYFTGGYLKFTRE